MKERYYDIIKSPVITEKSTTLSGLNKYVFKVSIDSSKVELKQAVEKIFSVKVLSVNTIVQEGKKKRFKGRVGKRSNFKKAIITLQEGQSIELGTEV